MIPDIPADVPADGISLDDYPHLAGLPLSPVTNAKVDLLIGQYQPDLLVPLEICRSANKAGQHYATRTKLGWALQGPVDEHIGSNACMTHNHIQLEQLNQKVIYGTSITRMNRHYRGQVRINEYMTCGKLRRS